MKHIKNTPLPSQSYLKEWDEKIIRLRSALEESVKLQSHYAGILNMYDGGKRMQFQNADAWMERLTALEAGEEVV